MKPIKLSELLAALDFDSPEDVGRLDLHEGHFVTVEKWILDALQAGEQEKFAGLPQWEVADMELARAIFADAGKRYVVGPDPVEFNEYRHAERFIAMQTDSAAIDQLGRAIHGRETLRQFKGAAERLGLLKQWIQYRDDAKKKFVVAWADARNLPYEDNLPPRQP